MGETKRRFKDQFNQHRRIEKILLYLKRAGLAGRNSAPSKQSSHVVSVSAFILFRVYFVWECDGELIYYPKDLAWRLAVFFCTLTLYLLRAFAFLKRFSGYTRSMGFRDSIFNVTIDSAAVLKQPRAQVYWKRHCDVAIFLC